MKEAAGEANMTVIVIVLIGVLAAAGAIFIPRLINNMEIRSCCTNDGGEWVNGACSNGKTYQKGCSDAEGKAITS